MIVHLRKRLEVAPEVGEMPGVSVRQMAAPQDVPAWLALRERAVASLNPAPRLWLHADYAAEMFNRPWWHAEWNWLAVDRGNDQVVGAVTIAIRSGESSHVPVVHWLLVDPDWQRRGIGRLLMSHLERAAWETGFREVRLETHAGWAAAVAFYQSMGYAVVRESPPR